MPAIENRPAKDAADAIAHIKAGGRAFVPAHGRVTVIDAKALARFERAGEWLLKDDGPGMRIRRGRGSDYLFAGGLRLCE